MKKLIIVARYQHFWRNLGYSLIPSKYPQLFEVPFKHIYKHFLLALILLSIITSLFYIPSLVIFPYQVNEEFEKFDTFSLDVNVTTSAPVDFGLLTVDTNSQTVPEDIEGIFIDDEYLYVNIIPFAGTSHILLDDLSDVKRNLNTIRINLILLTVFLVPYLLLLLFVYHAIKYTLIATLTALLVVVTIRTGEGIISTAKTFKIAYFGSIFLMLELFLQIFVSAWYVQTLIPFFLYFVFVIMTVMHTAGQGHHGKTHKIKDSKAKKETKKSHDSDDNDDFIPIHIPKPMYEENHSHMSTKKAKTHDTPSDSASSDIDIKKIEEEIKKHKVR